MYGSGLRLMEAVRLRVQDIDFDFYTVRVWQGKGSKNRRVTLAHELISALKNQIRVVEKYYWSYFTALICNTFTSKSCRHTNGTGTIRPQRHRTTQTYTHIIERGANGVTSPLSTLI